VAQDLGKRTLGELAFLAVVVLAVGNAAGRVVAGTVSDKLGRQWTMFAVFLLQAVVVFALYLLAQASAAGEGAGTGPMFIAITLSVVLLLGANYGANLSLFPSTAKDVWGMKGFGLNYGLLFTAWGAAGLVMPWVNGQIKDATGSQDLTYFIIIGLMALAAAMTFVSRALATRTLAAAKNAATAAAMAS
jgi:MFS family permease